MATAGDGKTPHESGRAGEISFKRPFRPGSTLALTETRASASISATNEISELEQIQKQQTFTRSRIQNPTTMENLPDDLLSNIFTRLFAKQVAQMRRVSKSWNALSSQSSFMKYHLHHSIHNNDQILLAFDDNASPSDPKPFRTYPCRSPILELTNSTNLPLVDPKSGRTPSMIKIIGSVHGLICSCYCDDVIHIWNPSLSALLTLPPHSTPSSSDYKIFFRFGFDPKTDDYKVVKVTGVSRPPSVSSRSLRYVIKEWLEVEVYSMRKGSWKFITQRIPSHVTRIINCDGVCVDGHGGHLHWLGYIGEEGKRELRTIIAFDLGSETFHELSFPHSVLDGKRWNGIGILAGKLCVIPGVVMDGLCEVWEMEEYGVAESWVKSHVFTLYIGAVVVLGITPHNEILFQDEYGRIYSCNPIERMFKILDNSCRGKYDEGKMLEYVDSLVWVAPTKLEVVDGSGKN